LNGVEKLCGDRDGDLASLRGRRFDAVVDTSGYTPVQLRAVADVLQDVVEYYLFVSSISVYRAFLPVATTTRERATGGQGGLRGTESARRGAIEGAMPGRVALIRPGLIVGPHDPSDRFTYWPRRVAKGGTIVAAWPPVAPGPVRRRTRPRELDRAAV